MILPTLPFQLIPLVISFVSSVLLALMVFQNNPKSATNRLFGFLAILLPLWLTANYLSVHSAFLAQSLFLIRASFVLATPVSALFFLLAVTIPHKHIPLSGKLQLILIGIAGSTMAVSAMPITIMSVDLVHGSAQPVMGPGMGLFSLVSTAFSIGSIFALFRKLRRATHEQQAQILYVLTGILAMLGCIIITILVPLLVFQTSLLVPLIPFYTLIFLLLTTVAIVKQRLMDIRLLVGRTVFFGFVYIFFVVYYTILLLFAVDIFVDVYYTLEQLLAYSAIVVAAGLTFQPLKRFTEKITNHLVFKNQYETNSVIAKLSKIMAYALRLDDVTHQVLIELREQVHITKAAFILFEKDTIADVRTEGYTTTPDFDENGIKLLKDTQNMLVFEELEETEVKTVMRFLDISIVTHLRTEGNQIGLLLVGAKSSGEIYSDQDIQLLSILSSEIAVSIQNALSYEQIRRFNITLQDKVDQATEDLRKANTRLEQLDKLKDEFVSLASHELRTPLTAIRSYIWMALSGKGGEITEKQRYYLDRSFSSANRLIKLVNGMLNISRIESGRMSIQLARTAIGTIIQSVLGEVQPKLQEAGLTLEVVANDAVPEVIADADKIAEVLMNFIGNSMKFTAQGGKITVRTTSDQSYVRVDVTDTGVGIAPENISQLFTKFGALRSGGMTDAVASQSTGLGLYICKSIISIHMGEVSAFSEGVGKGATFSFTLPIFTQERLQNLQKQYKTEGLGIIRSAID